MCRGREGGQAPLSQGWRRGFPLLAQLMGSLDGLVHPQLPVLGCQSIRFFIKQETQTKTSLGKGAWRRSPKHGQSVS